MSTEISFEQSHGRVFVKREDGGMLSSGLMTDILLFKVLEKLEEIRCGLIDVETAIDKANT